MTIGSIKNSKIKTMTSTAVRDISFVTEGFALLFLLKQLLTKFQRIGLVQ